MNKAQGKFFSSSQIRRKKIRKKSQIAGQIFIYILAIFVFAIIILYGYTAIKGFIEKGQETAFIQFKNTLEGEVSRISTEPGDIIVFNERNPLNVPGDYRRVCFLSKDADISQVPDWLSPKTKEIIISAINSGLHIATENVYLDPPAKSPIFLGTIETSPNNILCINITQGRLDIRLEGRGYGTRIS